MDNLIYSKIINVSRKVKPIPKDKNNSHQGYKFRGIDDMYNALQPLLSEEGVFITSKVVSSKREERQTKNGGLLLWALMEVEFSFWAEDGSSVSCIMTGEAMDSGDKASNKAMSTALKYALIQMFMIPTDEKLDTEYENHEPKTKKERGDIEAAIKIFNSATMKTLGISARDIGQNFEWTEEEKDRLSIVYKARQKELMEAINGN